MSLATTPKIAIYLKISYDIYNKILWDYFKHLQMHLSVYYLLFQYFVVLMTSLG